MLTVIKEIVTALTSLFIMGYAASWGLEKVYVEIQNLALSQVSKGLLPMTSLAQHLTCLKYDEKLNSRRIMTVSCGKYWRAVDFASERRRKNR